MRLGVAGALVGGELVPGDVEIDGGSIVSVGLSGGRDRGSPRPGSSTCRSTGSRAWT